MKLGPGEPDLGKIFSWLTRSGLGPRFGSRPIGWYQAAQVCAIDQIRSAAGAADPRSAIEVRTKSGDVQARRAGEKRWRSIGSVTTLRERAEACARR
jgi:hypothetical protein